MDVVAEAMASPEERAASLRKQLDELKGELTAKRKRLAEVEEEARALKGRIDVLAGGPWDRGHGEVSRVSASLVAAAAEIGKPTWMDTESLRSGKVLMVAVEVGPKAVKVRPAGETWDGRRCKIADLSPEAQRAIAEWKAAGKLRKHG